MGHQTDIESEPVLDIDSRKGVLIFFGFLVICGCFFVAGYVMGNRAASLPENYADAGAAGNSRTRDNTGIETYNRISDIVSEPAQAPAAIIEPQAAPPEITVPSAAVLDNDRQEPLEIASDVSTPVTVNTPKPPPKETQKPRETPNNTAKSTAGKATPPAKQAVSAKTVYSVQVAAFRARREAEIKARELEAKGFEPRIEPPPTPGDYYRLKVGNFNTRSAAAEMAERLKKSGFDTMISESKGN